MITNNAGVVPTIVGNPHSRLMKAGLDLVFELTYKNIRNLLDQKGIPVIVLKGPYLSYAFYQDPHERTYCDLDLLVPGEDFLLAASLLQQAGFKLTKCDPLHLANVNAKYNWGFQSPSGVFIELHRDFCDYSRYRADLGGIFTRARSFQFGETEALGLSARDLLPQLCLHAGKSFFITIEKKHLQDIALVIAKDDIEWDDFLRTAFSWGIRHASYYALLAAKSQFAAQVPEIVLNRLRPGYFRRCWLEHRLDPGRFPITKYPDLPLRRSQLRLVLALIDRKKDWLVFCFHYVRLFAADHLLRIALLRTFWLKRHPFFLLDRRRQT
jgi:hypothetical protein